MVAEGSCQGSATYGRSDLSHTNSEWSSEKCYTYVLEHSQLNGVGVRSSKHAGAACNLLSGCDVWFQEVYGRL